MSLLIDNLDVIMMKKPIARAAGFFTTDQHEQESKRAAQALQAAETRSQYEARKPAAWTAYFKPSRKCASDPITVECGNEYMRAKSRFEETYKDTQ